MTVLDVIYHGVGGPWTVARVAQDGADTFVEYTEEHILRTADLAPVAQPLSVKSRNFRGSESEHLPGLLSDSLPDDWGRLMIRRDMAQHGYEHPTPLDMLAWLGHRTMGALTFEPVTGPELTAATLMDLDRIQDEVLRYLAHSPNADRDVEQLVLAAGSGPGGARPKVTVADTPEGETIADNGSLPPSAEPWIIKLHGTDDSPYLSSIEATYLQMASIAGITTCNHQLRQGASGGQYLAVQRFDRHTLPPKPPQRIHTSTAAGLLERYPEYHQHLSYVDLVRLTRQITGDQRDVIQLVRRAIFNVLAHNRDDHARNFSYTWTESERWRLAPAYDLTFSMGPQPMFVGQNPGEHYLDIAGKGRDIGRTDLLSLAKPAGLAPPDIDEIIRDVHHALEHWPDLASHNGVEEALIAHVSEFIPTFVLH